MIGLGGTGGTALLAPAFRALPLGVPKVLVSTVASGNTAPYLGCSDIVLVPSVVDVAGLNSVSRQIFSNAAHAIAGMVAHRIVGTRERPVVGMTMFGVTTPCVTAVREALEAKGFDCLVFHATGAGGRAMEQLVAAGVIQGVLDITTTEVADEVVGGVFPAGPERFDAILDMKVPYVLSVGAMDMVNFGAMNTVPSQFRERKLHVHNAQVTLMRTTPEENRRFASWIAAKLNRATAPWIMLIPEKGVSQIDAPGQPFHNADADLALFNELESQLEPKPGRQFADSLTTSTIPNSPRRWCRRFSKSSRSKTSRPKALRGGGLVKQQETRSAILERLRAKVAQGQPIIGGGAGTGISAKCEEAAGIDLIVVYNSGRYRMAGRGSLAGLLPYGNANQIVKEMASEVLTAVGRHPYSPASAAQTPSCFANHFYASSKRWAMRGCRTSQPWD